jgi:hypothetical protein
MTNAVRSSERAALESIEHLKNKICLMWGSDELDIFISRLFVDSRDGQRKGLPMAVAAELAFLAETNKMLRAIHLAGKQPISLRDAYRMVDAKDQQRLEADAMDNPLVSRDTIIQNRNEEYRANRERARMQAKAEGPFAAFGSLIFRLIFSKATFIIIGLALVGKLLWVYVQKSAG